LAKNQRGLSGEKYIPTMKGITKQILRTEILISQTIHKTHDLISVQFVLHKTDWDRILGTRMDSKVVLVPILVMSRKCNIVRKNQKNKKMIKDNTVYIVCFADLFIFTPFTLFVFYVRS
jgi:hypothetical protein